MSSKERVMLKGRGPEKGRNLTAAVARGNAAGEGASAPVRGTTDFTHFHGLGRWPPPAGASWAPSVKIREIGGSNELRLRRPSGRREAGGRRAQLTDVV